MKTILIIIAALVLLWGVIGAIILASRNLNRTKVWSPKMGKYVSAYSFKHVFLPSLRNRRNSKVFRCLSLFTGYILWGYPVYVIILFIGRLWNKI